MVLGNPQHSISILGFERPLRSGNAPGDGLNKKSIQKLTTKARRRPLRMKITTNADTNKFKMEEIIEFTN